MSRSPGPASARLRERATPFRSQPANSVSIFFLPLLGTHQHEIRAQLLNIILSASCTGTFDFPRNRCPAVNFPATASPKFTRSAFPPSSATTQRIGRINRSPVAPVQYMLRGQVISATTRGGSPPKFPSPLSLDHLFRSEIFPLGRRHDGKLGDRKAHFLGKTLGSPSRLSRQHRRPRTLADRSPPSISSGCFSANARACGNQPARRSKSFHRSILQ